MGKSEIISEIESRVNNSKKADYILWTVGITDTPKIRKDQHANEGKDIKHWKDWSVSEKDGRYVEEHFLDKGMNGDTGDDGSVRYVYIF